MSEKNKLEQKLKERILNDGPVRLDVFMQLCLYDEDYGYYMQNAPFGRDGDFVTSPEITQLFGETLAIWVARAWEKLGSLRQWTLLELGPGRGTLMADVLRALKRMQPQAMAECEVKLWEISPRLRGEQAMALQAYGPSWVEDWSDVDWSKPVIVLANEFLDAFPIRQFVKLQSGWGEHVVTLDGATFKFDVEHVPATNLPFEERTRQEVGAIIEYSPMQCGFMRNLKTHWQRGAGLFIDYGYTKGVGDTLQGLCKHEKVSVFHKPGETDLTAHVNFTAMAALLGGESCKLEDQAAFLLRHGLAQRAMQGLQSAEEAERAGIEGAVARLIDPNGMGQLFKVLEAVRL